MLKLKDIFNIDISSKGGGKLYKKIMRKYNIPLKDVKEVKQEIVECSSGGGEVKEYYYKVLNPLEAELAIFANPIEIIYSIDQDSNTRRTAIMGVTDTGDFRYYPLYYFLMEDTVIAFKILDREEYISVGSQYLVLPKGNLHTKLALYGEEGLEYLDTCVQEITKEEYEAMITYKP